MKLLASVVIFFATASVALAAQDWKPTVNDTIAKLVADVDKSRTIWVDSPLDESGEPSFYPFLSTLHDAISSTVLKLGFKTHPNSLKGSQRTCNVLPFRFYVWVLIREIYERR